MNPVVKQLTATYEVNSKLLVNSFSKMDDIASLKRPNKKTNSMLFIALHLIDARYFILSQLGGKVKNPFQEYLDWSKSIDDIKVYPSMEAVLIEWEKLHRKFVKKINSLTSKELNVKSGMEFPGGSTALNMISFLAEHEAYHVGQLGFIRKFLGYPSVEY